MAAITDASGLEFPRAKLQTMRDLVRDLGSCVVAYSGGVDSAVVAAIANDELGACSLAVTAVSPSLAIAERQLASELARSMGIRHEIIETREGESEAYRRNDGSRCFHCKNELYSKLRQLANARGLAVILNGTNHDDLSDFRPGLEAARTWQVRSPLAESGITKFEVRAIARHLRLPVAEKPASPCLASRVAYGQEVTPDRLRRIDLAESYLRSLGFDEVRVRYHADELARIEVHREDVIRVADPEVNEMLVKQFQSLGFRDVTLDLQGFRSGSLNASIDIANQRLAQL